MTALSVSGVCKSYADTPVLRGVSLAVAPGSLTAILGASGGGKGGSAGHRRFEGADAGTIELGGQVVDGGRSAGGSRRSAAASGSCRRTARCSRT